MLERKYIIAIIVAIIIIVILVAIFRNRKTKDSPRKTYEKREKRKELHGKIKDVTIAKHEKQTQVSWEKVDEVDHYIMYYSEQKGFDKTKANKHDPVDENAMILGSDVPKGYYFRVTSVQNVDGKMVENELSDEHFMFLDNLE
jgi:FtsZ-interacting cell division protein ZipA